MFALFPTSGVFILDLSSKMVGGIALSIAFLAFAVINANAAVIVTDPSNVQGWAVQTGTCGSLNTSSAQYVTGPGTPPIGNGSFRMAIGSDGDAYYIYRNTAFDGVLLSNLTSLSYSTYVTTYIDSQAVAINLRIDTDNDNVPDDTLWFEPAYQGVAYFPGFPQGPLTTGTWQTWNALSGGWYTDNGAGGSGPGSNVKSFATILAALPVGTKIAPNGALGGLRLYTGCGAGSWDNFDGNVDNLTVGVSGSNTTYDFDFTCPTVDVSTTLTSKTTYPALTGVPVTIPVNTSNLTGLGIIAADFTFTYDPMILDPTPANISVSAGSVSPSAIVTYNAGTPGQVVVSVVDGMGTFTGSGTVANLNFRTIGPVGSTTALNLVNFRYNNTLVCSNSTNGLLTVTSGTLSGNVNYTNALAPGPHPQMPNGPRGVNDVTVSAAGSPNVSGDTDTSGNYALNNFGTGSYTVSAAKAPYVGGSSNPYNGIFSNDATLISKHVVGLITLSPTQIAAGKVSGLSTLSSFDAALVAQWIVGVPNVINQTGQWKITPASTVIPNMTLDQTLNFDALLMGDVNGDYDPFGLRPAPVLTDADRIREAVKVSAVDTEARAGSVVTVPVRLDNLGGRQVSSYEFDVRFDADVLTPAKVAGDIADTMSAGQTIAVNSPERGLLKVVVFSPFPAGGEGVYVNLRFVATGGVGTSSPVTIERFRFNDGLDDIFVTSGLVRVVKGSGVIRSGSTDIDQ